jgi:hypothetical protein
MASLQNTMVEIAGVARALNMDPHALTANPKLPLTHFNLGLLDKPDEIAKHWTPYHLFGALFKAVSKRRLEGTDTSLTDGQVHAAMTGYWTLLKKVYDDFEFMTEEYEVYLETMHNNAGPRNTGNRGAAMEHRLLQTGFYRGGHAARGALSAAVSNYKNKLKSVGAILDPDTTHMTDIITDLKKKYEKVLLENEAIINSLNILNELWKVEYNFRLNRGKHDPELKAAAKQVEVAKRNLGRETFKFLYFTVTGHIFTESLGEEEVLPEPQATLPEPQATLPEPQATLPEPQATLPEPQATLPQATALVRTSRARSSRSRSRSESEASQTGSDTDNPTLMVSRARLRRAATQRAN